MNISNWLMIYQCYLVHVIYIYVSDEIKMKISMVIPQTIIYKLIVHTLESFERTNMENMWTWS